MISALEGEIDALEELVEQPKEFVLPGESMTGAALDTGTHDRCGAPSVDRVALADAGGLPDSQVVPYLNRAGRPACSSWPAPPMVGFRAAPSPRVESASSPPFRLPEGCSAAGQPWRGALTRRLTR